MTSEKSVNEPSSARYSAYCPMPLPMPLVKSGDEYSCGSQPSAASSFANAGLSASTRVGVSSMAAVSRLVASTSARISGTSTRNPNAWCGCWCSKSHMAPSAFSEHGGRIEPRRPKGRHPCRNDADDHEHHACTDHCRRIAWVEAVQQCCDECRGPRAHGDPDENTCDDKPRGARYDEPDHTGCGRPERHADADLRATAGDAVRGQPIESKSSEEERQHTKESRKHRDKALLRQRGADLIGQRPEREHQIRIGRRERCGDGAGQAHRRAGRCANADAHIYRHL